MATPTETWALAVVGASARQVRSAPAQTIHLNPRILMPRLLNVLEAVLVSQTTTLPRKLEFGVPWELAMCSWMQNAQPTHAQCNRHGCALQVAQRASAPQA